jgi:hypothetical protein
MHEKAPQEILLNLLASRPDDQDVVLRLFRSYAANEQWLQALYTLDPDQERKGNYIAAQEEYDDYGNEYDYYDDYRSYPVERMKLSAEETAEIAAILAACAERMEDYTGQVFF